MILEYHMNWIESIDCIIERVENIVNSLQGYKKQWFRRLLDILSIGNEAIFWEKCSKCPYKVSAIAYTDVHLSFFDVYNHAYHMNIDYSKFPESAIIK